MGGGGSIGVRGGDRVLTHRLSNGFQRPPAPRLCAVRGLIRSDGSARLDSVKAGPLLSDADVDSHPSQAPFAAGPPPLGGMLSNQERGGESGDGCRRKGKANLRE